MAGMDLTFSFGKRDKLIRRERVRTLVSAVARAEAGHISIMRLFAVFQ